MPVHPTFNPDFLYFITTTTEQHRRIFRRESIIRIILDSLHFLRTSNRLELFCFVVMPNHIHLIGKFSREHPMSAFMHDFKRHAARQIIRQLMAEGISAELEVLQGMNTHDDQQYKVWEDSYDARDVFTPEFLWQKMEYIHYNPCRPKWNLAGSPEEYPWSSARFYMLDKPSVIPVNGVRELFV